MDSGEIHADARNIEFLIEKSSSMMSIKESGKADIKIYGSGMNVFFILRPKIPSDPESTSALGTGLELARVKCSIHKLGFRLHDTKHDWLYTLLGPLIRMYVKRKAEKEIEKFFMEGDLLQLPSTESITEAVKVKFYESQ